MANKSAGSNRQPCQAQGAQQNDEKTTAKKMRMAEKKEIGIRLKQFEDLYHVEARKMSFPEICHPYFNRQFRQFYHKAPSVHACINSFEAGIKWVIYHQQLKASQEHNEAARMQGRELKPHLLETIASIVEDNEIRNGPLPSPKAVSRKRSRQDTTEYPIDKTGLRNFKRFLKDEEIDPPGIWKRTMCEFIKDVVDSVPIRDACEVAFMAGIVWQKNRRKLKV